MSVRVFAPAKINLTLEVGRPRPDGLHPLQSAVTFADVGDWIEAAPAPSLSLRVEGPFADALAADESNLVLRAARALAAAAGCEANASIVLTKHLPIASGIGGGSADAAAALKALNALWRLDLPPHRLYEIARTLGADVPVCVAARPAYMTGAGETFAPMAAPELFGLLVNPGAPLATPSVYQQFDSMGLGGAFAVRAPPAWRTRDEALAEIYLRGNDLEAPACALLPAIDAITSRLRAEAQVRYCALSGSGATVFALLDSSEAAAALGNTVRGEYPQWWVAPARLSGA